MATTYYNHRGRGIPHTVPCQEYNAMVKLNN